MPIVPLHEVTDMMLVRNGLASLHELAQDGTVFGGPESKWCFGDHDYSIRDIEHDGIADEQYEVCARCHHVRLAPYLMVNGVEVSRSPLPEPAQPMPIAWATTPHLRLSQM